MENNKLDYGSYLQVDKIINCQELISEKHGHPAHIEMLYIIVHQAYELWFKSILHELNSVISMFENDFVNERNIGIAVARLRRIVAIQKLLIEQVNVLETMTPLDFLDFRHYLGTASGFQSFQYRLIENKLGLKRSERLRYFDNQEYIESFDQEKQEVLIESEKSSSLRSVVEKWLERTPFLQTSGFSFVEAYKEAAHKMIDRELAELASNSGLKPKMKEVFSESLESTRSGIDIFLDAERHKNLLENGHRKISYEATLAALFINLYRDEPILHLPFQLLETLIEIDEHFTSWRNRHAIMVHRMLGKKMGTGQSSGYDYLKRTAEKYRIFDDLFNISTCLIPRNEIPELPEELKLQLGFYFSSK